MRYTRKYKWVVTLSMGKWSDDFGMMRVIIAVKVKIYESN